MNTYLIIERAENQQWRAIVIDVDDEGLKLVEAIAEASTAEEAATYAIFDARVKPTHVVMPDGTLDCGDCLTLPEVVGAVWGTL